jgi:hypothetical protein
MLSRRSSLLAAAAAVATLTAAPAGAAAPPGDWTLVRKDRFSHYACKIRGNDGRWRLFTASDDDGRTHYPVDASIARGSNRNVVRDRQTRRWSGGYARMEFGALLASDRLWIQADGYGPPRPWSDGLAIRRITRCDPR